MKLTDLPEELVANIADRLISDDLFALRISCKCLEEKTLHNLKKEYFSRKCVHFTTDSLKSLVAISRSRFADAIKELAVSTGWFSDLAFTCPGRASEHYRPTVRQSEAYKFLITDQRQLKEKREDQSLLAEAFKRLYRLNIVSMVDSPTLCGDFTDYRGGHKVRRQTGTNPIDGRAPEERLQKPEYRQHVNHVFNTILRALGDAHEYVTLDSMKPMTITTPNSISAKALKVGPKTLARLAKVLRLATFATLQFKTTANQEEYREAIEKYAGLYPNATDIFLSGDQNPGSGWLCRTFMKNINTNIVTHFALNGLSIEGTVLAKMIGRMRKLLDLRLDWLDLTTDSWPLVLEVVAKLEHIDHLHLMYLREAGSKAFFRTQKDIENDYMPPGFDEGWEDEEDGMDDSELDTDDDLPDLEPVGNAMSTDTGATTHANGNDESGSSRPVSGATTTTDRTDSTEDELADDIPNYVPSPRPGQPPALADDFGGERGFYVCVSGHERILRHVNVFLKEYNVGESLEDAAAADFFGGMVPIPIHLAAGPGGANGAAGGLAAGLPPGLQPPPAHVMNNIMQAALAGAGPPFPAFGPMAGPGVGVNGVNNPHGSHNHAPAPAAAPGPAPPAPGVFWNTATEESDDEEMPELEA